MPISARERRAPMLSNLIQAVLLGGYYAIIACGLSFMFSVMRIINLAHGSLAVLSAYLIFVLADRFAINPFLGLAMVIPVMAAFGWALQRYLLERSARGGELLPVLTTFGLAVVLDNVMFEQFGADTRSLAPYLGDLSWDAYELGGIFVGKLQVLTMASVIAIIGGLSAFLKYTRLGRSIRATALDPDTAQIVGIDARRTSALAAAIAMASVAVAGAFLGMRATFEPYSGAPQLLAAFEATVIGGVGSLWGTLAGGIILAVAQTLGASLHPQGFLIGGHVVFLAVLFVRLIRKEDALGMWLRNLARTKGAESKA
jgi:branched-chain amino acid transport system permease protein